MNRKSALVLIIASLAVTLVTGWFYRAKSQTNTASALRQEAETIMVLPVEATILKTEPGDWGGDGIVCFSLPRDRPVGSWLARVWDLNPPRRKFDTCVSDPACPKKETLEPFKKSVWLGAANQSVEYDEAAQIYTFKATVDK